MYESPIKIIESTIDSFSNAIIKRKDDAIFAEIQSSFGVELDRGELIRALQYDRDQYNKGYADGKRDAEAALVRCKDCIHAKNNYLMRGLCLCEKPMHHVIHGERPTNALMCEDDFCSYGERREVDG